MRLYIKIISLALPIVLSRLIQTSGIIAGNFFVSILGANTIAASALATTTSICFFTFASGNLFGLSIFISRDYGGKDFSRILHVVIMGFYYATILSLCVYFILFNISAIYRLLYGPNDVILLVESYFTYFAPSIFPMLWTTVLQELLIGTRHQRLIYKYSFIRVVIGIFFAYVLVFGRCGFPAMGFIGLGLSVSVASSLSFLGLFGFVVYTKYRFIKQYFKLKLFIPGMEMLETMRFGVPIGLQMSGELLALLMGTLLVGQFGTVALASQQIASQYLLLFTMVPFGVSQSTAALISTLNAEGKSDLAKEVAHKSIFFIIIVMSSVGLIYLLFPSLLISIYASKHEQAIDAFSTLSISFFSIYAFYQVVDGVRIVLTGILRAHGNSMVTMQSGLLSFWLIAIPLAFILSTHTGMGSIAVPGSFSIAIALCTVALFKYAKAKGSI